MPTTSQAPHFSSCGRKGAAYHLMAPLFQLIVLPHRPRGPTETTSPTNSCIGRTVHETPLPSLRTVRTPRARLTRE